MKKTNALNVRALASLVVSQVVAEKRSLTDVLNDISPSCKLKERALLQAMSYGTLRNFLQLRFLQTKLLDKPLHKSEHAIDALLLVGLYQLTEMRIASHAAVNETVLAASQLQKKWAKGLLNAVLRSFLRKKKVLLAATQQDLQATTAHPKWLLDCFQAAYPQQWQDICHCNNLPGPMTLRVNVLYQQRQQILENLHASNIDAQASEYSPVGITLTEAYRVEELPGFAAGHLSVQDEAGQLCVSLLDIKAQQTVLDCCCAPGSKLCHFLETHPSIHLTGLDCDAERLKKVAQSLERLHLPSCSLLPCDSSKVHSVLKNQLFDRILVDAPCSATGVIRRHPDIKLLRRQSDIAALSNKQLSILSSAWSLLKVKGKLLYTTCSILPQENDEVIALFLDQYPKAKVTELHAPWGRKTRFGRQLLPGEKQMDGFFYCLLEK